MLIGGTKGLTKLTELGKVGEVGAAASDLFRAGEDVERLIDTPYGQVAVLAETQLEGDTVVLKSGIVSPTASERITGGMANALLFRSVIRSLAADAKAQGFRYLKLEGVRVPGSSSANPGHTIDALIDTATGKLISVENK